MKRYIILVMSACSVWCATAQNLITQSENRIVQTIYTYSDNPINTVTYYDGLGRPKQIVDIAASPDPNPSMRMDILTPIEYDNMGRQTKQHLPYAVLNNRGAYIGTAVQNQSEWYAGKYSDSLAYAETVYEPSPLLRPQETWQVGKAFRDAQAKTLTGYGTNTENEVISLQLSGTEILCVGSYSPAGQFYKTSMINEDGGVTYQYTDQFGNTILTRTIDSVDQNIDTYYVYDNLNRLIFVVTPEGAAQMQQDQTYNFNDEFIDCYCYFYRYNGWDKVIQKSIPGTETSYMVYDKSGRLVMSQDGNMKELDRWAYIVYDNLNRPVLQNIVKNTTNLSADQIQYRFNVSSYPLSYPSATDSWRLSVPFSDSFEHVATLSESRYGGYTYMSGSAIPDYLRFVPVLDVVKTTDQDLRTTGLMTYEKVVILDGDEVADKFVERAYYYDYKGRVIQTVEKNHLGGISRYSTKYDFVGNVLASHEQHEISKSEVPDDYELLSDQILIYAHNPTIGGIVPDGRYFISPSTIDEKYFIANILTDIFPDLNFEAYYMPAGYENTIQDIIEQAGLSDWFMFEKIEDVSKEGVFVELGVEFITHLGTAPEVSKDIKQTLFTYDHRGRLLSEETTLNDGKPAVVSYGYDELGKLVSKTYGNSSKTTTLDQIPVGTNIRGWKLKMNQIDLHPVLPVSAERSIYLNGNKWIRLVHDDGDNVNLYFNCNIAATEENLECIYDGGWYRIINEGYTFTVKDDQDYIVTANGLPASNETVWGFDLIAKVDSESELNAITETYDYNIQSWLTKKSSPVFDMRLRYFGTTQEPLKPTTTPSYTGNITEWEWQHKGANADNALNTYAFSYDKLSRLVDTDHYLGAATTPTNSFVERGLQYDKNSNIKELKRYSGGNLVDSLKYDYLGNKLTSLTEQVANPASGWDVYERGASAEGAYEYDPNGNMNYDQRKGLRFNYNFLNLLGEAHDSSTNALITKYTFLASGQKVSAVNGKGTFGLEYLGSLVYKRDANGDLELGSTPFGGGRITKTGNTYEVNYFITDHLGSTRVVAKPTATGIEVAERNDFYPFGTRHINPNAAITDNRYRFSGKEDQESLGLSFQDFGARMYDGPLGRWWSIDHLTEKYYCISPYVYCLNNPIIFIDPDGNEVKVGFNKGTNTMYITDLDHYKHGLPIKYVSAKDYQLGGIRDAEGNITHNQILVINSVFSGGQVQNGKIVRDAKDSKQKAIPNASYDIVDNDADTNHTGWFRLDRDDNSPYNDRDDETGRDGYRFHLGGLSWGCVTVSASQEGAEVIWEVISSILNSTSTTTVKEKRGKQWLNPKAKLTRYGTMSIFGVDNTQIINQEEEEE